jgi:hypothetical protein
MASARSIVNQMVPSAAAAIATGASCALDSGYSTNRAVGAALCNA